MKTKQTYTIILYDIPVNILPKAVAIASKKTEMLRISFVATSRFQADTQFSKWLEAERLKPTCNPWLKLICDRGELRAYIASEDSEGHFNIGNYSGN